MSLVKKYDRRLRKLAFRPVWLPGTKLQPGDILRKQGDAFKKVGSLKDKEYKDYDLDYTISSIGEEQSIKIQGQGVFHTVVQNSANVKLADLDTEVNAELKISFQKEDSYFLRTPAMNGTGLDNIIHLARKISGIQGWNFRQNFVVHNIWSGKDFVFLGSSERGSDVRFSGKGQAVKELLDNGITSHLTRVGTNKLSTEVLGKGGPIVMQLFRVKRNGEFY
jgi:hypothetical protein